MNVDANARIASQDPRNCSYTLSIGQQTRSAPRANLIETQQPSSPIECIQQATGDRLEESQIGGTHATSRDSIRTSWRHRVIDRSHHYSMHDIIATSDLSFFRRETTHKSQLTFYHN